MTGIARALVLSLLPVAAVVVAQAPLPPDASGGPAAESELRDRSCKMPLGREKAVTKEALLEKIEALPPEKKAEVEDFVDFLAGRRAPASDRTSPKAHLRDLVATIEAGRERLLKEKGLLDSAPLLREFRETGE